jgi:hypothetical protein
MAAMAEAEEVHAAHPVEALAEVVAVAEAIKGKKYLSNQS